MDLLRDLLLNADVQLLIEVHQNLSKESYLQLPIYYVSVFSIYNEFYSSQISIIEEEHGVDYHDFYMAR